MINPTRREFLTLAAATTAALAGWRCGGQSGSRTETRTMFFNFRHEPDADAATYHLILGGRRHPILHVQEQKGLLDQARQTNTFLQNVPDASITHVIPSFISPGNEIQIAYVMKNRDVTTGLWSMSSVFFVVPLGAVVAAHEFVMQSGQPITVSAKRMGYGQSAAQTAQDVSEEESLADVSDHATALVSFHNEILSGHPGSAAYIQKHLVQRNVRTFVLGRTIMSLGEAAPEIQKGQKNPSGWATLTPYLDDKSQPLRAKSGSNTGLILYNTEWSSQVQNDAGAAINGVLQKAKDDTSLGADITSAVNGGERPPLAGTIWTRRDGVTSVEQSGDLEAEQASSDVLTITPSTPFNGYSCDATITQSGGNTMVTVNTANWYLRWLGVWVEFVGKDGPIKVSDLADFHDFIADKGPGTAALLGALGPEWTLYGVPLAESTFSKTIPFPPEATSAHVIASGLGRGSKQYLDTIPLGEGLTVCFNLVCPGLIIALGAAESFDAILKKFRAILMQAPYVQDAFEIFLGTGDEGFDKSILTQLGEVLAGKVVGGFLQQVFLAITEFVAEDAAVDCIPIAGQILEAVGAVGTLVELVETSAEVATSPWTYVSTLTATHDVSFEIVPDTSQGETTTPDGATVCVVTGLFDSGATPRVVIRTLTAPVSSIDVRFASIPFGGNITVSAGFYQGAAGNPHHILLGQATSGLVPNTTDSIPDLVIKRIAHPILSTTKYTHVRKTVLDDSDKPAWLATTTAPTETQDPVSGSNLCANQAGSLCRFHGITVRQASAGAQGFLGYAWEGFGTSCHGGSSEVDLLANANTGQSAADGYATVSCGLGSGAKIAYSLLGQTDANFYFEPESKVLRQVQLGATPSFEDPIQAPTSTKAWGQLNFPSDALLLHPTGIVVSVSTQNHRLETLVVPAAAVTDTVASTDLLANVHGGQGSRPGLLSFPIAAAVSPDGTILVLEAGDDSIQPVVPPRIQAFDVGGNSVPFFKNLPDPHFLNLAAAPVSNVNYLDIAVEHSGLIYVLSYEAVSPYSYQLDVYRPDQSDTAPISTTTGFNAARIAVDFWRNVYTLNYEVLKKQDGTLPELTEPSVSEWGPQG